MRRRARLWTALAMTAAMLAAQPAAAVDRMTTAIPDVPALTAGGFNAMTVDRKVLYFIGVTDVLVQAAAEDGRPNPIAACKAGRPGNWVRSAMLFDHFIEKPDILDSTLDRESIADLSAVAAIEMFLPLYCKTFR